jgi:hypothetical protein
MRTNINPDERVEISGVQVDRNLPQNERVKEYNRQKKDPNHYKCGGIKINAFFKKDGPPIEKCLTSIVTS